MNVVPAWSPDGKSIAYVHREMQHSLLRLVSPLGGPARTVLASDTRMGSMSWLPDSRTMVLEIIPSANQSAELWVVWLDTGRHRQLTSPPAGIPGDTSPAVSPDGRSVAFARVTAWHTAELYLLDLNPELSAAGVPRRLTALGYTKWPAWTPDGKRIVFESTCEGFGLCQVDRGGGVSRPVFGPSPDASQPSLVRRPGGYTSLAFTDTTEERRIVRYETEPAPGAPPKELAPSSRSQRYPRFSPDGTKLAFASNRSGFEEIWVANADGSQPSRLTDMRHSLTEAPDWSPSGDLIAFLSQSGAGRQIYVVSVSGGAPRIIAGEEGIVSGDGWAADGAWYYFSSRRSGGIEVWKAPRSGGRPLQVTAGGGQGGFESSQGLFYYWKGERGSLGTLLRRTPTGDQPVPLTPQGITCRTAPSSKGFYFTSVEDDVYLFNEATGLSERVLRRLGALANQFTVSPDGRWLARDSWHANTSDLMMVERFR